MIAETRAARNMLKMAPDVPSILSSMILATRSMVSPAFELSCVELTKDNTALCPTSEGHAAIATTMTFNRKPLRGLKMWRSARLSAKA